MLEIAVQAAMGLAAVHNFDKEGRPSVAHTGGLKRAFLSMRPAVCPKGIHMVGFCVNLATEVES